jgi:probable addiction module antidote protein
MPRLTTTPWDVVEHLKSEEDMALYLEAAFDEGDPVLISAVIGDIARARGVTDVAVETGADQETSSEMVTTYGGPDLATMLSVIKAVGLRLRVSVGR